MSRMLTRSEENTQRYHSGAGSNQQRRDNDLGCHYSLNTGFRIIIVDKRLFQFVFHIFVL